MPVVALNMTLKDKPNMEGFADLQTLRSEAYQTGAFFLGNSHPDHGAKFPIGLADDRHIFINAGSRAGKGTTLIVNNLIHWPHGVVCIDPKGENASLTAMRRASPQAAQGTATSVKDFVGQDTAILDPLGCVRGPARALRVNYDPLSDIKPDAPEATSQILAVAESVVIADEGDGQHFTDTAQIVMAGVIEMVLHTAGEKTLRRCRETIMSDDLPKQLEKIKTPAALAQEAHGLLTGTGENELGSIRSTLSRQMQWMADPRMIEHLSADGFSLRKIVRENGSVFICIPPLMIPRMKRWLRVIVRVALDTKMEDGTSNSRAQTLFMLDEFPALGHFQLIEDAAGYMAGYGIKLVSVIQNLGQVQKLYPKNWETFIGNAGAFIGWGLNDLATEQYMSDRMGQRRSLERSTGRSGGALSLMLRSRSVNWALQDRPLRWPNEIRAQGARETMRGFVIPAKGAPFTIERINYWEAGNQGKFEPESYINEWETKHGAKLKG